MIEFSVETSLICSHVHVHSIHHKLHAPFAFGVFFTHPIEQVCVNLIPVLLPMIFIPPLHVIIACSYLTTITFGVVIAHSGFVFPGTIQAGTYSHDFHHASPDNCYGIILMMDYLHGTDTDFRKYMLNKPSTTMYNQINTVSSFYNGSRSSDFGVTE